jgi:hypothetical protein
MIVGLAALLGVMGAAGAQGEPPAILFEKNGKPLPCAVKALSYRADKRAPGSKLDGTQYVEFKLSVRFKPPKGTRIISYEWMNVLSPSSKGDSALYVLPPGNGSAVTACAYRPRVYYASCTITYENVAKPADRHTVAAKADCAVIGGPIWLVPETGQVFVPGPDSPDGARFSNLPTHDDANDQKPFHLQYFGFDPTRSTPESAQLPRSRLVANCLTQPAGTRVLWSGAKQATDPKLELDPALQLSSRQDVYSPLAYYTAVGPTAVDGRGRSAAKPIRCKFVLEYKGMHGSDTLEAWDDTATTGFPGDLTRKKRMVNRVNVHMPVDTKLVKKSRDGTTLADIPRGGSHAGDVYTVGVVSQLGMLMPGVHVQERYATPPPSWYPAHVGVDCWTTASYWPLSSADEPNGTFALHIERSWKPGEDWLTEEFRQDIVAGTRTVQSDAGVPVGSWLIRVKPGKPNGPGTTEYVKLKTPKRDVKP